MIKPSEQTPLPGAYGFSGQNCSACSRAIVLDSVHDELFVPLVTVTRVGAFDEALAEANAIDYGLTAGVFSSDPERARPLPRRDRGRRRLRQPARRRDDRRVARLPVVCGWKSSGSTGKGGPGPYYVQQRAARS